MAFEAMVGLQLAVGFYGTAPTPVLIRRLKKTHASSLVIFARNFRSPGQFRRLIRGLEKALGFRLLVMVDHEGGRIIRFGSGITRFPAPLSLRNAPPVAAGNQGMIEAEELKALGVSVNLAPCVDVLVDGCDPVIGDRSYGSTPGRVSALSVARISGLQSCQVAACAKHFPGLGSVPRDPHKVLPTVRLSWPVMSRDHLAPFRAAIRAKTAAVMSSHVCYPALGDAAGCPATFSRRLVAQLLRKRLKFQGVILTDDLEMGALRAFGGIGEAAVQAVAAGHDMALVCSDLEAGREAFVQLRKAYQTGRLPMTALKASASRIIKLRRNFLCPAL